MESHYYTPERLEAELAEFERRFGLTTDQLVAAHGRGEVPPGLSQFDVFSWATTYSELRRMREARDPQPVG